MAIWLSQTDLQNFIGPSSVLQIFDDGTGVVNTTAVAAVIDRAEQEVLSWLVDEYGPNPATLPNLASDSFLKYAALEYAIAHAFDRHPEYVRANGKERMERFARADARMERVLDARQRPTSLPKVPASVGGAIYDNSDRIITDNADGTKNSGDY